jgi:Uri superfamily endonuclease
MTYLTIYQIEQKNTILIKMANEFQSIGTFGQVEQSKTTSLFKMKNNALIKWVILCYIISNVSFKLS